MRYDLIPEDGLLEVHKVFNQKLEKYGKDEWRKGIPWSDILSNLEKHLSRVKRGEDFDKNGLLNIAIVAEEALILAEYYKKAPMYDDRKIGIVTKPIVCSDLDDVIFDFTGAYEARYGKMADYWSGDYAMLEHLTELQKDKDFWVNMPLKNRPSFEIDAYCTARSIPVEWTMEAIAKNNLPTAPVKSLPWNADKVQTLKELGCSIFIDDKYENYKACTEAGIFCYLLSTPANQYYNVGHRRITDLNLQIK